MVVLSLNDYWEIETFLAPIKDSIYRWGKLIVGDLKTVDRLMLSIWELFLR